jgi:gluconate 5-dehydrogenase
MSLESLFSLKGKTALVAGASRGIGLAIAKEIAAAGAHTVLASRSIEKLQAEATALNLAGYSAEAVALDMESRESIQAVGKAWADKTDILINVAGRNVRRHMESYSREEYELILQTNLHSIFELTQLVGKGMVDRGKGGKIINIGSLMSTHGVPYLSVYAISKAGIAGLTRVLAAEWGPHNIQVNCIAPGFIITDINRDMWQAPVMHGWLQGTQSIPKAGAPEDIAGLAVFLAAPASNYVTGQCIASDGGWTTTARWPFEPAS